MSRVKDQYHDDMTQEPEEFNPAEAEYYAELERHQRNKERMKQQIEFETDTPVEVSGTSRFYGKTGKVAEVKLNDQHGYLYSVTFDEAIDMPKEINNGQPITGSVFFANELTEAPSCHM